MANRLTYGKQADKWQNSSCYKQCYHNKEKSDNKKIMHFKTKRDKEKSIKN